MILRAPLSSQSLDRSAKMAEEYLRLWRTCPGCRFFDDAREVCMIANQRPPAKVIALGCKMFDGKDDLTPF